MIWYPKLKNSAIFCIWEDARVWVQWNHSFNSTLSGASILCFPLSFFQSLYWICYNIVSVLCFGHKACEILATWPGIKPTSPALDLTTGPPGKSQIHDFLLIKINQSLYRNSRLRLNLNAIIWMKVPQNPSMNSSMHTTSKQVSERKQPMYFTNIYGSRVKLFKE